MLMILLAKAMLLLSCDCPLTGDDLLGVVEDAAMLDKLQLVVVCGAASSGASRDDADTEPQLSC